MLDDRDEKYEGHEEEYHFSEEEVSYEVDAGSSKSTSLHGSTLASVKHALGSRRILLSVGVFVFLVFAVYKMVAPSVSSQATDIAAVSAAASPRMAATKVEAPAMLGVTSAALNKPAAPRAEVIQPSTPSAPQLAVATAQTVQPVAQSSPTASPMPETYVPTMPATQMASPPSMPVPTTAAAPVSSPGYPAPSDGSAMPGVPASLLPPVTQSPDLNPPTVTAAQPLAMPLPAIATTPVAAQAASASLQAEKLMAEAQAQYTEKLSTFETQNKALQDQLQTLNSRVGSMETQLNQLVQALIQQGQRNQSDNTASERRAAIQSHVKAEAPPRIAYNVQAIIPGRAWLKSDNGETITVAEGDSIKNVGRVTKIDPYDGVIEINTGSQVVSLTYGTTA